jgi:hypothetical protein
MCVSSVHTEGKKIIWSCGHQGIKLARNVHQRAKPIQNEWMHRKSCITFERKHIGESFLMCPTTYTKLGRWIERTTYFYHNAQRGFTELQQIRVTWGEGSFSHRFHPLIYFARSSSLAWEGDRGDQLSLAYGSIRENKINLSVFHVAADYNEQ